MKKFNIQLAKKGHPVVTSKGKDAKILLFDRDNIKFPLVVIIENKEVACYTIDGKFFADKDSEKDLKLK